MKHYLFILLSILSVSVNAQIPQPRIKLNQIIKDTISGSVVISSPTDSGMVYSRNLYIQDTVLLFNGDTVALKSNIVYGGGGSASLLHGVASGTDTYTVTIDGVTSYSDADSYLIRFTNGNTTISTLNINSLGAIPLYKNNDGQLIGGDIQDGAEMLCVYNSSLNVFQVIGTSPNTLLAYVTNAESTTITRGQPVYAFGGTGDRLTVKLASNIGDSTSAQTVGLVLSTSIAAGQKGFIVIYGQLDNLDIFPTSTWADGDAVYLGATPGSITKVKPYAPNHLVYLGYVTTASNGNAGRMYVRVQNGYEMNELHDVQISSLQDNDIIQYDLASKLWQNKSLENAGIQPTLNGTGFVKASGTTITYDASTYTPTSRTITTTNGITGGGDLSQDRTLELTGNARLLHNVNTVGLLVRKSVSGMDSIVTRLLQAGDGIAITYIGGSGGDPIIASTITQYTDALARQSISLTTNGTSGAATYDNLTGVLNIPQYEGGTGGGESQVDTISTTGIIIKTGTSPSSYTTKTITTVGYTSISNASGLNAGNIVITTDAFSTNTYNSLVARDNFGSFSGSFITAEGSIITKQIDEYGTGGISLKTSSTERINIANSTGVTQIKPNSSLFEFNTTVGSNVIGHLKLPRFGAVIEVVPNTDFNAAGNNLTIQAGDASITGIPAANGNGGNLILKSGATNGTGVSSIEFWTGDSPSNTPQTITPATVKMSLSGAGTLRLNALAGSGTRYVTVDNNGDINATGTANTVDLTTQVTGILPIGNGGTGVSSLTANKVLVGNNTSGVLSPTNLHWDNTNSRLGIKTASPQYTLDVTGTGHISTQINAQLLYLKNSIYGPGSVQDTIDGKLCDATTEGTLARVNNYFYMCSGGGFSIPLEWGRIWNSKEVEYAIDQKFKVNLSTTTSGVRLTNEFNSNNSVDVSDVDIIFEINGDSLFRVDSSGSYYKRNNELGLWFKNLDKSYSYLEDITSTLRLPRLKSDSVSITGFSDIDPVLPDPPYINRIPSDKEGVIYYDQEAINGGYGVQASRGSLFYIHTDITTDNYARTKITTAQDLSAAIGYIYENIQTTDNTLGRISDSSGVSLYVDTTVIATKGDLNSYLLTSNYIVDSTRLESDSILNYYQNGTLIGSATIRIPSGSSSQWITSGSNIYYSTGNVGINQTTPTSKLHIIGAGATSATSSLNIANSSALNLLSVRDDGLITTSGVIDITSPASTSTNAYALEILRSSTTQRTGALAIGGARFNTSNPLFATIHFINYDNNSGAVDYIGASIDAHMQSSSIDGADLAFSTSSSTLQATEKMRLTSAGNLGINTSEPAGKLHVAALTGDDDTFISRNSADTGGAGLTFRKSRGTSVTSNLVINQGDNLAVITAQGVNNLNAYVNAARIAFGTDNSIGANIPSTIEFSTGPNNSAMTERMRITSSGRVGIGTNSPTTVLDVQSTSTFTTLPIAIFETFNIQPFGDVNMLLATNSYYDNSVTNWKALRTGKSVVYQQIDGYHILRGTNTEYSAGATITDMQTLLLSSLKGTHILPSVINPNNNTAYDNRAFTVRDSFLVVDTLNRVGINTSTPGSGFSLDTKLHIVGYGTGTTGRTSFIVENKDATSAAAFRLVNSSGAGLSVQASGSSYSIGAVASLGSFGGIPITFSTDGDVSTGGTSKIFFKTGGFSETNKMTIDATGNVGIGTETPAYKLDVVGDVNSEIKYIHLKKTDNQAITAATYADITWQTQTVIDTDVFTHTASSDDIYVDKAGIYMIIAKVSASVTDNTNRSTLRGVIAKNNTVIESTSGYAYLRGNSGHNFGNVYVQTMISLAANDYVTFKVYGTDIDATGTAVIATESEFIMYRMGY